jgi:hypothetical protein
MLAIALVAVCSLGTLAGWILGGTGRRTAESAADPPER